MGTSTRSCSRSSSERPRGGASDVAKAWGCSRLSVYGLAAGLPPPWRAPNRVLPRTSPSGQGRVRSSRQRRQRRPFGRRGRTPTAPRPRDLRGRWEAHPLGVVGPHRVAAVAPLDHRPPVIPDAGVQRADKTVALGCRPGEVGGVERAVRWWPRHTVYLTQVRSRPSTRRSRPSSGTVRPQRRCLPRLAGGRVAMRSKARSSTIRPTPCGSSVPTRSGTRAPSCSGWAAAGRSCCRVRPKVGAQAAGPLLPGGGLMHVPQIRGRGKDHGRCRGLPTT
jgi:hypothetical protein